MAGENKYEHLGRYLADSGAERVRLTFEELDDLCSLPQTAYLERPFWANTWQSRRAQTWLQEGYVVDEISLGSYIVFRRDPHRAKDPGAGRKNSASAGKSPSTGIDRQRTAFKSEAVYSPPDPVGREKHFWIWDEQYNDPVRNVSAEQLAAFCEKKFNLTDRVAYGYRSLSVCILDCVYSLRARYDSVTVPVVDRYAARYMNGDRTKPGDTVSTLLQHMDEVGGPEAFATKVLGNHQKIGGVNKSEVCCQLAQYLKLLQIETIEDFRTFASPELLEIVIRAVKGLSDAGVNYLFMLAGDPNRCKPDVHIHHCIRDACGKDVTNEMCQQLFTETVEILKKDYKDLTVRDLDHIIWSYYHSL